MDWCRFGLVGPEIFQLGWLKSFCDLLNHSSLFVLAKIPYRLNKIILRLFQNLS